MDYNEAYSQDNVEWPIVQISVLVATIQTKTFIFLKMAQSFLCNWSFEARGGEGFLVIGDQTRVSRS